MATKFNVGIVGCGNISGAYVNSCRVYDILKVVACADIDPDRARAKAAEFDIPKAVAVADLLGDPEIDIVINLTVPNVHAEVNLAVIEAGKHVYSEKPLATRREEGRLILATAQERGVRVGCAPDTFLGGGLQTCRKLIDDGWIGEPVAATAFLASHGPESWHPNPEFFYQAGAGPMFDMGPYYLTTLINLIGPIKRVTASARISFAERLVTSKALYGQKIAVQTPTHVAGLLEFDSGAIGTMVTSFDVWSANLPRVEIYGTEGSLSVPDPNIFGGLVRVRRANAEEWSEMPHTHQPDVNRGIGVADMAHALASGRPHRASGEMAYHVLDAMQAFLDAAEIGQHVSLESYCERPQPLPMGLRLGELD